MSTTPIAALSGARTLHLASAACHLVVAMALIALAVAQASILLPVALSVPVASSIGVVGQVDLAAAAAVVLLISAIMHGAIAIASSPDVSARRARLVHLVAFAQASAITLFLVAQLNGVAELGALVLVYAISGGAVGFLWLQAREDGDRRRAPWPYSLAAAIAAVPWGIVALYQIAGIVAGSPPPPVVRVLTLVILVLVALAWWAERRWQLGLVVERRTALVHSALSLANGVVLLMLAIGLARPSALL